MRSLLTLSFLAIATLGTASCGPKVLDKRIIVKEHLGLVGEKTLSTESFTVHLEWLEGPHEKDYSRASLTFTPNGTDKELPALVELVEVKPWMKVHGHGTGNKKIKIQQVSATVFELSNIFFIMDGPWELEVTAKLQNEPKKHIKTVFTFEVPKKS